MSPLPLHSLLQVIEALPTPLVVVDSDDVILGLSAPALTLLGAEMAIGSDSPTRLQAHLKTLTVVPCTTDPVMFACDTGDVALIGVTDRFRRVHVPKDVAALAGEVAHDFNNLLGVIINFASLAAADMPAGSAGERDLREVIVASKRGAAITQRLLDVGRVSNEGSPLFDAGSGTTRDGDIDGVAGDHPLEALSSRFKASYPPPVTHTVRDPGTDPGAE